MKTAIHTHSQEEILEHLWMYLIEEENELIKINELKILVNKFDIDVDEVISQLSTTGYIVLSDEIISLTKNGKMKGKLVVRRRRLAERLLFDVLDLSSDKIDNAACSFEHVLSEDVEENVCTLLGHPSVCPHDKPIPKGFCCKKRAKITFPAVIALSNVGPGHEAIVSYITTKKYKRLHKLMAFGILPGSRIQILRNSPGTVIKFDETVIALEPDVTQSIFLRKVKSISK
ncbi:MAG: metal-dependent transcriptional regulator [Candidatus Hodarchaeales archaeon]|jgi:DtxR family Mn-dependent transcriptional regulator